MSSNAIMMFYQVSSTKHPSFNIKTQLGKALSTSSLAGATGTVAFCPYIAGDVWGQSSHKTLKTHSEIVL